MTYSPPDNDSVDFELQRHSPLDNDNVTFQGNADDRVVWGSDTDWDLLSEETGISHEELAFTDNTNDSSVKKGYKLGDVREGLVAYYPMERGQSTHLHDAALDNHGVINGASWVTDTPFGDYALGFVPSNDDNIRIGDQSQLKVTDTNRYAISFWVNTQTSSTAHIFGDYNGDGAGIFINFTSSDVIELQIRDISGNSERVVGSTIVTDSTWHFVTVLVPETNSASDFVIFVDGAKENVSVQSNQGASNFQNNRDVMIGSRPDGTSDNYEGFISELRLHERALSEPEIQTLFELQEPQGTFTQPNDPVI